MKRKNVRITAMIRVSEGASYSENTLSQKEVTIVGAFECAEDIISALNGAILESATHVNNDIDAIAKADAECQPS